MDRLTLKDINQILKGFKSLEEAQMFIRKELILSKPTPRWRVENGVIYFTITPEGLSGSQIIERAEKEGIEMSDDFKSIVRSDDFTVSPAGVPVEVAILTGPLFKDEERLTKNIRAMARGFGFKKLKPDMDYYIRKFFSNEELKELKLYGIVTMHNPIEDSDGGPRLLSAHRYDYARWLRACYGDPSDRWDVAHGFAFWRVSQVSPKNL